MNDTIQYGFYNSLQSNEESYKPFQQINYNDKKDKHDNFCPICHYNYNSHYHKKHCPGIPIGDGISLLLFIIGFYLIYKRFKS